VGVKIDEAAKLQKSLEARLVAMAIKLPLQIQAGVARSISCTRGVDT